MRTRQRNNAEVAVKSTVRASSQKRAAIPAPVRTGAGGRLAGVVCGRPFVHFLPQKSTREYNGKTDLVRY